MGNDKPSRCTSMGIVASRSSNGVNRSQGQVARPLSESWGCGTRAIIRAIIDLCFLCPNGPQAAIKLIPASKLRFFWLLPCQYVQVPVGLTPPERYDHADGKAVVGSIWGADCREDLRLPPLQEAKDADKAATQFQMCGHHL